MATEPKHDVFICFRGTDCRDEFLPHLVDSLKRAGIIPFIDTDTEKGVSISPQLLTAIAESWSLAIVMSQIFATSTWCLGDLEENLKNRTSGLPVMPIGYRVDPSDVRKHALAEFGNLAGLVFPSPHSRHATHNFNHHMLIVDDSYGSVFMAFLDNGSRVAQKRQSLSSRQGIAYPVPLRD
ncbi:hypothetical protein RJ640_001379 [Escallonia rubra]|uniref:TIR domain-containing protein n=1 Tax=Escallonia rubra TaxID=112253 RepID=A0AA88QQ49_9ASTE|nr:hypothetical protein RJ640_001379 [Escallonia rubra]